MSLSLALLTVATLHIPPALEPQPAPPRLVMMSTGSTMSATTATGDDELVFYFVEPTGDVESSSLSTWSSDDGEVVALPCPLHATLRSLGRWLLVLLSMVFVAALLGSVSASRRPLPLAALAVRQPSRAVPLIERVLVLACLWSPMLMLLGLLQAEREMLSSVLLCMSVAGAASSSAMLAARRRLMQRLRWAAEGQMSTLPDGVVVRAEVEPKRLCAPPGDEGPTPWFRADLVVANAEGEAARVSLDGALVDDEAARALLRMAMGLPAGARLTVLGAASRAPADAASASPLDRMSPTQARIVPSACGRALVVGGSTALLARKLRIESVLLTFALAGSVCAALLTLAS